MNHPPAEFSRADAEALYTIVETEAENRRGSATSRSLSSTADRFARRVRSLYKPGLVLGCATVIVLGGLALSYMYISDSGTKAAANPHTGPVAGLVTPPTPFISGKQIPLSEAAADASFPAYRPQSFVASDKTLSAVWFETNPTDNPLRPVIRQLAFLYNSGVTVIVKEANYGNAGAFFRSTVQSMQGDATAEVITINGSPALSISNPVGVDVVVLNMDGIEVAIYGAPNQSSSDLVAAARSVGP